MRALLFLWRVLPLPRWLRRLYLRLSYANVLLGASAVILDEQGRVLVLEHTYRPDYAWGLPGGFIGKGEPLDQGLRREVREETGLDVEVAEPLAVQVFQRDELDVIFRCRVVGGRLQLGIEARHAEFRALDDLDSIDLLPNHRAMLVQAGLLPSPTGAPERAP